MSEETVTISLEEYTRLQDAEDLLMILYSHGVDNWQYFDDAIEEFHNGAE